jgi:shikimate kinase
MSTPPSSTSRPSAELRVIPDFGGKVGFLPPLLVAMGEGGSPEHLNGALSRRLPAPVLHAPMRHILDWANRLTEPGKALDFQRLLFLEGGPGIGKTELGIAMAQALNYRLAVIPAGSCAGDFSRLAIDYQFGSESSGDVITQVNKLLTSGAENEREILKQSLSEFLAKDKKSIDVTKLGESDIYRNNLAEVHEALRSVRPDASKGGAAVEVKEITGPLLDPLIKYVEEKRQAEAEGKTIAPMVVVLDEFNRYENTDKLWQNFWEVASGNRDNCTMEYRDAQGNRAQMKFTKEDLESVMFIGTGNSREQEPGVHSLGGAWLDRAKRFQISPMGPPDLAHRMQQLLMGIPVITWVQAAEKHEGRPLNTDEIETITRLAEERRVAGLSEADIKNIPALHHALLKQPLEVAAGLTMVADAWDWLDKLKSGKLQNTPAISATSREELKALEVTPRKLKDLLIAAQARSIRTTGLMAAVTGEATKFSAAAPGELGDRIVEEMLAKVSSLSDATLRDLCYRSYYNFGLISADELHGLVFTPIQLNTPNPALLPRQLPAEALTAAQLINCNSIARLQSVKGPLRGILCGAMRTQIPGLAGDGSRLITDSQLSAMMLALEHRLQDADLPSFACITHSVDPATSAMTTSVATTSALLGSDPQALDSIKPEAMMTAQQFLASLLLSDTQAEKQWSALGRQVKTLVTRDEEPIDGSGESGLLVTAFAFKGPQEGSPPERITVLHVPGIEQRNMPPITVLIGEAPIDETLRNALRKKQHIHYFSLAELQSTPALFDQMKGCVGEVLKQASQCKSDALIARGERGQNMVTGEEYQEDLVKTVTNRLSRLLNVPRLMLPPAFETNLTLRIDHLCDGLVKDRNSQHEAVPIVLQVQREGMVEVNSPVVGV